MSDKKLIVVQLLQLLVEDTHISLNMDSKPQEHVSRQKPSKRDCAELQKLSLASCYFLGKCAKMLKEHHDTFSILFYCLSYFLL